MAEKGNEEGTFFSFFFDSLQNNRADEEGAGTLEPSPPVVGGTQASVEEGELTTANMEACFKAFDKDE